MYQVRALHTFEVTPLGHVQANPITYLSDGKQQVATAAGKALFAFGEE